MFKSPIIKKALWYSKRKVVCKIVYRVSEKKLPILLASFATFL